MEKIILRTNAIPVYGFLSFINAEHPQGALWRHGKILDCGAGGPVPPLALFAQHGFEAWGIDVSDEQLDKARQFCEQHGIGVQLRTADMQRIPFEDETFDYVYEHYSLCHLSKQETARAVGEMYRVLKRKGLCFLGLISADSWPRSAFGQEKTPGEYWGEEGGERRLHSLFRDEEIDDLLSDWEVVGKEKRVMYSQGEGEKFSMEEWMAYYEEAGGQYSREAWRARYETKAKEAQYAHWYFILRKPLEDLELIVLASGLLPAYFDSYIAPFLGGHVASPTSSSASVR
jgi:SAM-dependent methyltransferase